MRGCGWVDGWMGAWVDGRMVRGSGDMDEDGKGSSDVMGWWRLRW